MLICLSASTAFGQIGDTSLPVLKISEVTRVDRNTRPSEEESTTAAFILKTAPHATLGDAYVIVTDQTDDSFLQPLQRLAAFHHGSIIHVDDLTTLLTAQAQRDQLTSNLRAGNPRFVAIAPRLEHFNQKMILGMWNVLAALGDDQRLPVYPAYLVAPTAKTLGALVDRSIHHTPQTAAGFRPFVIGQVLGPRPFGQRSLQKARMMRRYFSGVPSDTASLVVLADTAVAMGVTVPGAPNQWQTAMNGPGQLISGIPGDALPSLDHASLLLLFGHGSPGSESDLRLDAFRDVQMTGEIVMSGNCNSAPPVDSTAVPDDSNFAMLAIDHGADVFYGHMEENVGFPYLFPVLESWMDGQTVGEAYQRLINAALDYQNISPRDLAPGINRFLPAFGHTNDLLYVIIGDPALQPFSKLNPSVN